MKFKSILRKAHEAYEDAIAHLRLSMLVGKEKVILPVYGVSLVRQLRPVLAVMAHLEFGTRLPLGPGIREERHGELTIRQLAYLPRPLKGRDAVHNNVLAHNDAKLVKKNVPAKDPGDAQRRHISQNVRRCTSPRLPSGACTFAPVEFFVFYFSETICADFQPHGYFTSSFWGNYCLFSRNYSIKLRRF